MFEALKRNIKIFKKIALRREIFQKKIKFAISPVVDCNDEKFETKARERIFSGFIF